MFVNEERQKSICRACIKFLEYIKISLKSLHQTKPFVIFSMNSWLFQRESHNYAVILCCILTRVLSLKAQ